MWITMRCEDDEDTIAVDDYDDDDDGFYPIIHRHIGIWGAADEAVLNNVRNKTIKTRFKKTA